MSEAADHGRYFPNGQSSKKNGFTPNRTVEPRQPGYLDSLPVRQCLTTKLIWGGKLVWFGRLWQVLHFCPIIVLLNSFKSTDFYFMAGIHYSVFFKVFMFKNVILRYTYFCKLATRCDVWAACVFSHRDCACPWRSPDIWYSRQINGKVIFVNY